MKYIILFLIFVAPIIECNSQVAKVSFLVNDGVNDGLLKKSIESNTSKLLNKINEAFNKGEENPQFDEKIITSSGIEQIQSLWNDSRFYCTSDKIVENILQKENHYQARNLPFMFNNSDKFDVVLEYLPDGRINDFYIGLEAHQYKSVLDNTSVIDRTRREIILNFLENLRTAYVKKDIDYIQKLYSDKALIIIGKVLKPESISTDNIQPTLSKNQIEYQVMTKSEYINRLNKVFVNIKYLHLDFKNIEVVKHRKYPNFYGVLLEQSWETSSYRDDGLLFLLVQFKENEDPIIWVRTWQDAKNTPAGDVFGLHNFKISGSDSVK